MSYSMVCHFPDLNVRWGADTSGVPSSIMSVTYLPTASYTITYKDKDGVRRTAKTHSFN